MESVLNIKVDGGTLSGFLYKDSTNRTYLVTARHAFEQQVTKKTNNKYTAYRQLRYKNADTVHFFIKSRDKWVPFSGAVFFHNSTSVDIAVIKVGIQGATAIYTSTAGNQILGQDVYFLGFPFAYKMYNGAPNINFPYPLVKKGIFSGINAQPDGTHCLFVDGNNTYGFSGGPVIYYDYFVKKYLLLGIISGYIPQTNRELNADGTTTTRENSGIIVVSPETYLIQIIKKINS
jgi:hypothetical protein